MMGKSRDWTKLDELVRNAEQSGGRIGLTIFAPDGDAFVYRGDQQFRAASTVKVPLMIEIYRQIDRGQRSLDDRYELRAEDRAPGSGVMLHLHQGAVLTLNDLIYLMISISDNTATNVLIELAGMENINGAMRSLGMSKSTLGRKMKNRPAKGDERENWATPNDYATVVREILQGRAASELACAQMTAMLEKQQNKRRISRYLPDRPGIRWGSKTGSIEGVTNDIGFIETDRGVLILSVFCENLPDQHVGEKVIGDIARAAMEITNIVEPLRNS